MTERQKKELASAFLCLIPATVVIVAFAVGDDKPISQLTLLIALIVWLIAFVVCLVGINAEGRKPTKAPQPRRSAWYFFLNRIAELSCAVRGKRVEEDKPKDSETRPD